MHVRSSAQNGGLMDWKWDLSSLAKLAEQQNNNWDLMGLMGFNSQFKWDFFFGLEKVMVMVDRLN